MATNKKTGQAAICVLDEPGWWPLIETYKWLLPRARTSTAFELLAKLKSGELRCVRRSKTNPSQYEPELASFWSGREFDADYLRYFDELYIYGTDAVTGLRDPGTRLDAEEFYVCEPDKVWPALAPPQTTKENEPEGNERGKTGPPATDDWQACAAFKYCEARHKGLALPSASDLMQFCADELGHRPDRRSVNRLLEKLRRLIG
jgi:hypothetical protein